MGNDFGTLSFIIINKKEEYKIEYNKERSFAPREMFKIKCSKCGKDAEVPFKPIEGREVYCKICFSERKRY